MEDAASGAGNISYTIVRYYQSLSHLKWDCRALLGPWLFGKVDASEESKANLTGEGEYFPSPFFSLERWLK